MTRLLERWRRRPTPTVSTQPVVEKIDEAVDRMGDTVEELRALLEDLREDNDQEADDV